jgi:hypothetical protein
MTCMKRELAETVKVGEVVFPMPGQFDDVGSYTVLGVDRRDWLKTGSKMDRYLDDGPLFVVKLTRETTPATLSSTHFYPAVQEVFNF